MAQINQQSWKLYGKEKSLPRLLINLSQEYAKERLMMFCLIVKKIASKIVDLFEEYAKKRLMMLCLIVKLFFDKE